MFYKTAVAFLAFFDPLFNIFFLKLTASAGTPADLEAGKFPFRRDGLYAFFS